MQPITPEQNQRARDEVRKGTTIAHYSQVLAPMGDDPKISPILGRVDAVYQSTCHRIATNIKRLRTSMVLYKTRTVDICFKISHDGMQTVFGYIHADCEGDNINYKLACAGPTYHSMDGEYRSRIISLEHLEESFTKYAGDFPEIEDRIVARLASGDIEFTTDIYQAISCSHTERKIRRDMLNMRMSIKLLFMCWICDVFQVYHGVEENHINTTYKAIIAQDVDFKILKTLIARVGREELFRASVRCSFQLFQNEPISRLWPTRCGQKVFPLSPLEALKTDDINYAVWRELYVTVLASNLVLNFISPSFPFIINWFYIQNANADLFDNKVIQDQYFLSEVATNLSAKLKEIDRLNYMGRSHDEGVLSPKFARISKDIHRAVAFADSSVRLTDLALCMLSEWVGRTIRDIPSIIGSSEGIDALPRVFGDIDIFSKHMFEFIYGFYCMNSRAGLIHSDLHLNNTTIFMLVDYADNKRYKTPAIKGRKMLFVAAGMPYLFESTGLYSMVIDLSKAIVGDRQRLEHEFGVAYAEIFLANQTGRILHLMNQYFADFMEKHGELFLALLKSEFPLIFKALSALDTFVLMTNFRSMMSIDAAFASGRAKIADGAVALLDRIIEQSEELILSHLDKIISGELTAADDIEWPNLLILRENFTDYEMGKPRAQLAEDEVICDVFNSELDMPYTVEDPDTWGPILGMDVWVEAWKRAGVYDQLIGMTNAWNEYAAVDETPTIERLAEKYQDQEGAALQFEEWMLL